MRDKTIFAVLLVCFLAFAIQYVNASKPECDVKYEAYDCHDGKVCRNGTCGYCLTNEECHGMNPEYICTTKNRFGHPLPGGTCIHKEINERFDWRDIVTGILLFLTSSIAGSSGLGGGGLFVPILFLVGSFDAHEAVPLSKSIIFGGAVANLCLNIHKRFPGMKNKLLTDYNIAAFMTPSILAGTTMGVTLNVMLPAWLILILLAATLCLTTWRMAKKGLEKYRQENATTGESSGDDRAPLISHANINESEEEKRIPTYKLLPYGLMIFLVLVEAFIIVLTLMKGSKEGKSILNVKLCSPTFFAIFACIFIVVAILVGIVAYFTYQRAIRLRRQSGFVKSPEIVNWTKKNMVVLSFGSFIGGILAGLVGIGGGMVSSPILLEIGVHPQIVVATSTFLILFTSSTTTIQFLILGKLPITYSLAYGILAFVSNIFGNLLIDYLVKKSKKTYIIIAIVTIIVALSAVMLGISGVVSVTKVIESGHGAKFHSLCYV
jgi:uncharacterized membrane protein YfcA